LNVADLLQGEKLVLRIHGHWVLLFQRLLPPVTVLIVLAILAFVTTSVPGSVRALALGVAFVVLGVWALAAVVQWLTVTLSLTDRRVILDSGALRRQSRVIPLGRIQDVHTTQSVPGRILNYGRIAIASAGSGGEEIVAAVMRPYALRDEIFARSERRRGFRDDV
jgi:uncharacterized membrane protein YdbT with pleckstrin-like domain